MALKDRALDAAAEGVTIADARLPDRPLIYANEGFERMTGYPVAEVIGRNCRFLQGPETDPAAVAEIRTALAERRECVVEILNYRRDGTRFWNRLSISPVRGSSGEVTHFIRVQSDVTARRLAEDGLRRSTQALEQDQRVAARVQQALLPPAEFETGSVRIAHVFHPCDDLAGNAEYGHPGLIDALARYRDLSLRAGLAAIVDEVRAWCGGRVNDDVSLLAVERLA